MNDIPYGSVNAALKENQIVSLDYLNHHLYGEVIQLIPDRRLCWFRPLCLSLADLSENDLDLNLCLNEGRSRDRETNPSQSRRDGSGFISSPDSKTAKLQMRQQQDLVGGDKNSAETKLIDLQSSSDLLWPDILFRPAFDLEIVEFLPQLSDISQASANNKINQKCLNKFVFLVWQAHQDKF